jgi:hypothetical protein
MAAGKEHPPEAVCGDARMRTHHHQKRQRQDDVIAQKQTSGQTALDSAAAIKRESSTFHSVSRRRILGCLVAEGIELQGARKCQAEE